MPVAGPLLDAAVLGAGPAGAAAALELSRLGYAAAVVSRPRSSSVEGLSMRALASLSEAGLGRAAESASAPTKRVVYWGGQMSERGQECIVDRGQFDARLRASVEDASVTWIDASVRGVSCVEGTWQIETTRGLIRSRAVLDARGRHVRRSDGKGPLLAAWNVLQHPHERAAAGSAVAGLNDCWCWVARTQDGLLSLQFVGSAGEPLSSDRLAARMRAAARALPAFRSAIERLADVDCRSARAAVARYSQPSRGIGFLRIGDAAVAMDPLSGNGIHEAVRSARAAVAAIHSYLLGVNWSVVARFVDERARELWRRGVTAAADFYRLQAQKSDEGFWSWTASAYERASEQALMRHEGPDRFEMRPVLDGGQIALRRVWVCAEWPRGVWKVGGHTLDEAPAGQIPFILRGAASVARHEV